MDLEPLKEIAARELARHGLHGWTFGLARTNRRLGVCKVGTVEVLGLADAGASTDPLELSQKRATVVAQALAAAGLPAPSFDLVARGAAGSTTPSGSRSPSHRRTEVVLHAAPAA